MIERAVWNSDRERNQSDHNLPPQSIALEEEGHESSNQDRYSNCS
jgi:hypothetical protein